MASNRGTKQVFVAVAINKETREETTYELLYRTKEDFRAELLDYGFEIKNNEIFTAQEWADRNN